MIGPNTNTNGTLELANGSQASFVNPKKDTDKYYWSFSIKYGRQLIAPEICYGTFEVGYMSFNKLPLGLRLIDAAAALLKKGDASHFQPSTPVLQCILDSDFLDENVLKGKGLPGSPEFNYPTYLMRYTLVLAANCPVLGLDRDLLFNEHYSELVAQQPRNLNHVLTYEGLFPGIRDFIPQKDYGFLRPQLSKTQPIR